MISKSALALTASCGNWRPIHSSTFSREMPSRCMTRWMRISKGALTTMALERAEHLARGHVDALDGDALDALLKVAEHGRMDDGIDGPGVFLGGQQELGHFLLV